MCLINVNPALCIKCGICSNVCPTGVLSISKNGPEESNTAYCIGCGHCVAVCPNGALHNSKAPLSKTTSIDKSLIINSKAAEHFLRSRRSVRCYKNIPVSKEKLLKLINIANYAPTASNSQNISYIIVENKKILDKATKIIIEWMEDQLENPSHKSFPLHVNRYKSKGI